MGYTVFVGGVVCPTLATFLPRRLRIPPAAALWSVIVGGGVTLLGRLAGGDLLTSILTEQGHGLLSAVLGPRYASILPIILSALILAVSIRKQRVSSI